jgi:hypothetical protein
VAIHGQVSFKNFTVIVEQVTTSGDTAAEIKHKERQLEAQYATGNCFVFKFKCVLVCQSITNCLNTNSKVITFIAKTKTTITVITTPCR